MNVLAAGGCTMRWNGRTFEVTDPEIVGADVGLRAFAALRSGRSSARFGPIASLSCGARPA